MLQNVPRCFYSVGMFTKLASFWYSHASRKRFYNHLFLFPAPLSPCDDRLRKSAGGNLALWNHVPFCKPGGGFEDVQCNVHTANCWCVNINGLEFTETQANKIPNCATPGKMKHLSIKQLDYEFQISMAL